MDLSWTAGTSLNTARGSGSNQLGGTVNTSVLVYGGTNPASGKTESWDGTSWTEIADMATSTQRFAGASTNNSNGFAAGGGPTSPASKSATEEFHITVNTITGAAWASGGNLGTARYQHSGAGTQTAGLVCGGYSRSCSEYKSEEYNGSAWAEGNDLNTARSMM